MIDPRTHRRSQRLLTVLFVWTLVGAAAFRALAAGASAYGERWVYCSANLQVDRSADDVITLIERASRDGYTAVMLADYKLQILDRVPDFYFRNVERAKAAAARARIELIPAVFSIGYSNGRLEHDPNLAEGLPVVDQPFVVREQTETVARKGSSQNRNVKPSGLDEPMSRARSYALVVNRARTM
jgi:hypothetical protein